MLIFMGLNVAINTFCVTIIKIHGKNERLMGTLTVNEGAATISDRLRELRKNKGLLQREAAAKVNLSTAAWSNYETGLRTPSTELLKEIAKAFNVSLEYVHGLSANIDGSSPYFSVSDSSEIALSRKSLQSRNISEHNLIEVVVSDDAMYEAFAKGETVFINTAETAVKKHPQIYAIENDSGIVLRGIRGELSGVYTLFTHNKKDYSDQTLTKDQLKNLSILGKYIGHWRWAEKESS